MKILSIETSCDDTGIAIIEFPAKGTKTKVLSSIVSSQTKIHQKWGGVYPTMAKREHQKNLVPVLIETLMEAKMLKKNKTPASDKISKKLEIAKELLKREDSLYNNLEIFLKKYGKSDIDIIAVTVGPGLEPCLWAGVNFAKSLASFWNLKIIPVNHVEAHILANWLPSSGKNKTPKILFPAVCLIVSGGHTQLIFMEKIGKYKIIGETRDDAAGECFDKTARILGLGYPGGPVIAEKAGKFRNKERSIKLPRPMIRENNYDFSFSGLKTAVLYDFKNRPEKERKSQKYIEEICFEMQQAVIDVLALKTMRLAREKNAKTVILGGGVSSNNELRKQFEKKCAERKIKCIIPPKELCTDNGIMTALAGFFNLKKSATKNLGSIEADSSLRIS